MILMYNQQIESFRLGTNNRVKVGNRVCWKVGSLHMVKSDKYGKAKTYARILAVSPVDLMTVELELERVTVFEYLKARRPGWEQAVII